jgi:hypothetical protein
MRLQFGLRFDSSRLCRVPDVVVNEHAACGDNSFHILSVGLSVVLGGGGKVAWSSVTSRH